MEMLLVVAISQATGGIVGGDLVNTVISGAAGGNLVGGLTNFATSKAKSVASSATGGLSDTAFSFIEE